MQIILFWCITQNVYKIKIVTRIVTHIFSKRVQPLEEEKEPVVSVLAGSHWSNPPWSVVTPPLPLVKLTHYCPGSSGQPSYHLHHHMLSTWMWQGSAEKLMYEVLQHVPRWKSFVWTSCPGDNMVITARPRLAAKVFTATHRYHWISGQSGVKDTTRCCPAIIEIRLKKGFLPFWNPSFKMVRNKLTSHHESIMRNAVCWGNTLILQGIEGFFCSCQTSKLASFTSQKRFHAFWGIAASQIE